MLAVEQGWMTQLVEEVVPVLTEVGAADEREQTRSQCLSWSWKRMKKKWRRLMVECVGYGKRMMLSLKRSSHY